MGWAVAEIMHRTSIYQFKLIIMGNPKDLAMYAIIDASSVETKTSDFIQRMVLREMVVSWALPVRVNGFLSLPMWPSV